MREEVLGSSPERRGLRGLTMRSRLILGVAILLCLWVWTVSVGDLYSHFGAGLWDFKTAYYAAKASAAGLNPYDNEALSQIAGHEVRLPFVYLPITLWFYRVFSLMDLRAASYLLLALKSLSLIFLLYLWRKEFLHGKVDLLFYPFCLVAFSAAFVRDILSGNVSMFEEVLIWIALWFYLKNRYGPFCLLIVLASCFKLTPILLLALLLFGENGKNRYAYLFGACISFMVIILGCYVASPVVFRAYLHNAFGSGSLTFGEIGAVNPATLPLVGDTISLFVWPIPKTAALALYLAVVAVVILLTWRTIIRLNSSKVEDRSILLVFLVCVAYALILPRFKDYAYILLLAPTYFIVRRVNYVVGFAIILGAELVLTATKVPDTHPSGWSFPFGYYPLVLAYCVWLLYIYTIAGKAGRSAGARPALLEGSG
jgi:hypothetical protein